MACLPRTAASDISGINRVDNAFSNVDGKNNIGRAIPFIIPKRDIPSPCGAEADRQIGTSMFSIIRSREFKYLPEVIGSAMSDIAGSILYGLRVMGVVIESLLKSVLKRI